MVCDIKLVIIALVIITMGIIPSASLREKIISAHQFKL